MDFFSWVSLKFKRTFDFFTKRRVYYFDHDKNMGDLINENIFKYAFGEYVRVKASRADYIMIGSLLEQCRGGSWWDRYKKPLNVLGTGFLKDSIETDVFHRRLNLIAVRGELTKNRLVDAGYDMENVLLGDWALAVEKLYPVQNKIKEFDIGLIVHYADEMNPEYVKFRNSLNEKYNVKCIDIKQDFLSFMGDITRCNVVLSSAMHGLIVADSYHIPNFRISFESTRMLGGSFKFLDYYSIYSSIPEFYSLEFFLRLDDLIDFSRENYSINYDEIELVKNKIFDEIERLRVDSVSFSGI